MNIFIFLQLNVTKFEAAITPSASGQNQPLLFQLIDRTIKMNKHWSYQINKYTQQKEIHGELFLYAEISNRLHKLEQYYEKLGQDPIKFISIDELIKFISMYNFEKALQQEQETQQCMKQARSRRKINNIKNKYDADTFRNDIYSFLYFLKKYGIYKPNNWPSQWKLNNHPKCGIDSLTFLKKWKLNDQAVQIFVWKFCLYGVGCSIYPEITRIYQTREKRALWNPEGKFDDDGKLISKSIWIVLMRIYKFILAWTNEVQKNQYSNNQHENDQIQGKIPEKNQIHRSAGIISNYINY